MEQFIFLFSAILAAISVLGIGLTLLGIATGKISG
jgi:hypothetical protein